MAVRRSSFCCSSSLIFLLISWLVWTFTDNLQNIRTPGISIRLNLKYRTAQFRCIRYFRGRIPYCCNSTPSFNLQRYVCCAATMLNLTPVTLARANNQFRCFIRMLGASKLSLKTVMGPVATSANCRCFRTWSMVLTMIWWPLRKRG